MESTISRSVAENVCHKAQLDKWAREIMDVFHALVPSEAAVDYGPELRFAIERIVTEAFFKAKRLQQRKGPSQ